MLNIRAVLFFGFYLQSRSRHEEEKEDEKKHSTEKIEVNRAYSGNNIQANEWPSKEDGKESCDNDLNFYFLK